MENVVYEITNSTSKTVYSYTSQRKARKVAKKLSSKFYGTFLLYRYAIGETPMLLATYRKQRAGDSKYAKFRK